MRFYSGFALRNEESFFSPYCIQSDVAVYGFSYGAVEAFSYAKDAVRRHKRLDKLVLFSPAFFQNKSEKFIALQLRGFRRDPKRYIVMFFQNCFAPYPMRPIEEKEASLETLEHLLRFRWEFDELRALRDAGVSIEVYLGGRDAIIDADAAYAFFRCVADVTYIKEANHFLLTC